MQILGFPHGKEVNLPTVLGDWWLGLRMVEFFFFLPIEVDRSDYRALAGWKKNTK